MTDIQFGRLVDLALREAWPHEAHQFTPWLAENIGHLAEAINMPLELTGTEVPVESFAADILARNPQDGSIVLIENQLEQTDHKHLGQIMTYLAGLQAQTVIWIAPSFREPHLSAIRWLNEHTADGFSFFAVKARVVRIGDSPYAPIFEIVEKPNNWERQTRPLSRSTSGGSGGTNLTPEGLSRRDFWEAFSERHPELGIAPSGATSVWIKPVVSIPVVVALWIGQRQHGAFLRGLRNETHAAAQYLAPRRNQLERLISASMEQRTNGAGNDAYFGITKSGSFAEETETVMNNLKALADTYSNALRCSLEEFE